MEDGTHPHSPVAAGKGRSVLKAWLYHLFSGPSYLCPFCGSSDLTITASKSAISVSGGRLCKVCGADYTPPIPKLLAGFLLMLCIVGFAALILFTNPILYGRWIEHLSVEELRALPPSKPHSGAYIAESVCLLGACFFSCVLFGAAGRLKVHWPGKPSWFSPVE